ncbi:hypothetical protein PCANC_20491 [Puccinia coronata f. sp. avenae]|uniref:Uncharacterized protein n=1 Tax=Puccinia coronata f. sp. avenae TaxID=200324 RepID=A0A2N5U996_9BASI|nr:hypothetical protein PCANC_20491 [Puccinia coronata f. sp. avenae]PLW34312.1 hypothetical protein PCASD_17267 [Puccinia coronata f. sp. avenae]
MSQRRAYALKNEILRCNNTTTGLFRSILIPLWCLGRHCNTAVPGPGLQLQSTPTVYGTSLLGATPKSRQAGTVPACWELLPTSWYSTNSLGATPYKLRLAKSAAAHPLLKALAKWV